MRNHGQKNLQDKQWNLVMPPEWVNELLKHDFISSKFSDYIFIEFDTYLILNFIAKKGRGSSSILISTMGQARI